MTPQNLRSRLVDYLSLERNVAAASLSVLLLGFGEELWKKFLPKYLESLGAGPAHIGFFGTARDLADALYQYPGGWIADRFGRRRAFVSFLALAVIGYVVYLLSPSWQFVFIGLAFTMAWQSMASPAIFAVIGDSLPKERRAMGFTFQSILKRIPMVVSPIAGGVLMSRMGPVDGVRWSLAATLLLAAASALIASRLNVTVSAGKPINIAGVWRSFHGALKRLLVSDIIVRLSEGMVDVLVVLYATNVTGITLTEYGVLVAVQMVTSMLVYIPAARIADRIGRKPFVIMTFLCFALFPASVILASNFTLLVIAFIIGGLREIGEPARKAMIVDLAEPELRARTVGLYYLCRGLSIAPAGAIGGLLWKLDPHVPFVAAGITGIIGTVVFAATVEERYAS
jgi:MFS family permease